MAPATGGFPSLESNQDLDGRGYHFVSGSCAFFFRPLEDLFTIQSRHQVYVKHWRTTEKMTGSNMRCNHLRFTARWITSSNSWATSSTWQRARFRFGLIGRSLSTSLAKGFSTCILCNWRRTSHRCHRGNWFCPDLALGCFWLSGLWHAPHRGNVPWTFWAHQSS